MFGSWPGPRQYVWATKPTSPAPFNLCGAGFFHQEIDMYDEDDDDPAAVVIRLAAPLGDTDCIDITQDDG